MNNIRDFCNNSLKIIDKEVISRIPEILIDLSTLGKDNYKRTLLFGTQSDEQAIELLNKFRDFIEPREDLWFKKYEYGYVYQVNLSFLENFDKLLPFIKIIFQSDDFYLINDEEEYISKPHIGNTIRESHIFKWCGWLESDIQKGTHLYCDSRSDIPLIGPAGCYIFLIFLKILPYLVYQNFRYLKVPKGDDAWLEIMTNKIHIEMYNRSWRREIYNSLYQYAQLHSFDLPESIEGINDVWNIKLFTLI